MSHHERLAADQKRIRDSYEQATKSHENSLDLNRSLRAKIDSYWDVLSKLVSGGTASIQEEEVQNGVLPLKESISCLKPLVRTFEIVTPNVKARATVYSQQVKNGKTHSSTQGGGQINTCASCKKSHDQHQLAHCDTCKLHYHLQCLTPPLTRMPKKSANYGWSCSECYPDSSSDSNTNQINPYHDDEDMDDGDAATRKRNRKRRLAASKALIANSRRNSSDFETEWPMWAIVPKIDASNNDGKSALSSLITSASYNSSGSGPVPPKSAKSHQSKKVTKTTSTAKSLYKAASNAASALLVSASIHSANIATSSFESLDDAVAAAILDDPEKAAAKAAAKAERKQIKRAEKERRKLEKKKRKILEKQQRQMKEV